MNNKLIMHVGSQSAVLASPYITFWKDFRVITKLEARIMFVARLAVTGKRKSAVARFIRSPIYDKHLMLMIFDYQ